MTACRGRPSCVAPRRSRKDVCYPIPGQPCHRCSSHPDRHRPTALRPQACARLPVRPWPASACASSARPPDSSRQDAASTPKQTGWSCSGPAGTSPAARSSRAACARTPFRAQAALVAAVRTLPVGLPVTVELTTSLAGATGTDEPIRPAGRLQRALALTFAAVLGQEGRQRQPWLELDAIHFHDLTPAQATCRQCAGLLTHRLRPG